MTSPESREQALTAAFADVTDTMVADFDVLDLLDRLANHCVNLLDVAEAGLLLANEYGQLRLLASSSEQGELLDLLHVEVHQGGPCLESFRTGQPVAAADLARYADTWPWFVDKAQRLGFHTVHALPMRLREDTTGVLNLFRTETTPLTPGELVLAQALADLASIGILQQRAIAGRETLIDQLQGAMNSRVLVEQAKGALAERGDRHVDEAFVLLRDYARAHNVRLSALARQVLVDRRQAVDVLSAQTRGRVAPDDNDADG